ncbi:MAG TPA: nitroreductase/quinone reductase family protein [Solirubrobacteraceae bacterium]
MRRAFQRIGRQPWFAAFARRVGGRTDRLLYRATGGRFTLTGSLAPVLLLTTRGRRSGRPRTTPVIYVRDGDGFVVSSEDYGQPKPAAWPLNLDANPDATVELDGQTIPCRGRRLSEEEADRHWPALCEVWPAHAAYRERSGTRHTFRLDPVDG